MRRKAMLIVVAVLAVSLWMVVFPAPSTSAEKPKPMDIRLCDGSYWAPPFNKVIMRFMDTLNAASNGEYHVRRIGGSEIMAQTDVPAGTKAGVFEMGFGLYTQTSALVPAVFPLLHAEVPWPVWKSSGAAAYIQEQFEKAGLHHLVPSFHVNPEKTFWNHMLFRDRKIEKIADLKGLKMGNPSPIYLPLWKAYGCEQVVIQQVDWYEGLSRGLINAICHNFVGAYSQKIHEVVKYALVDGFSSSVQGYYLNLATWKKLSKTAQENITKACDKYDAECAPWIEEELLNPSIAAMKEKGMIFIKLSPDEEKKFREGSREALWAAAIAKDQESATKLKGWLTKK